MMGERKNMQNVIQRLNERRVNGMQDEGDGISSESKTKSERREKLKEEKVRSQCRGREVMDKLWLGKTSRDVVMARIVLASLLDLG